jgi:hypothetical protein
VTPRLANLPANVAVQTIVPDTVQVVISAQPPASVTPAP